MLRLRATDRLLEAELLDDGTKATLALIGPGEGLRADHFSLGVDVEVYEGGARYAVEGVEVLEFDREKNVVVLPGLGMLGKVRRRAKFRERIAVPLRVVARGADGGPPRPLGRVACGTTIDVGGGGLSFELEDALPLAEGDLVRVELMLGAGLVSAVARVAWVTSREEAVLAGLAFLEVEDQDLQCLYRSLFDLQRGRRSMAGLRGPRRD